MAKKYLDYDGLLYLWQKIRNTFVSDVAWDSTNKKLVKKKKTGTNGAEQSSDLVTFATVATTGSYNDLSNTPTIPVLKNVFGKVKVGSTTIEADTTQDTLELEAGSNVTLTPDTTNDKVTIGVTIPSSGVSDVTVDGTSVVTSGVAAIDLTGKVDTSDVGAASGICPLDSSSKVDASYLPSYVDDVIEAYPRTGQTELSSTWLSISSGGSALTPETGKIYILMADSTSYAANTQFRWSGSTYVKLADGSVSEITNGEIDTIVAS